MGDPEWLLLAAVGRDDLARRGVDGLRAAPQLDRLGAVPDPGQGLGPGVEPARDQQVTDLLLGPRRQRRQIERRRLTEAWEQVGQDVMNCEIAAAVHRPHHPRRVCRAAVAIRPRGTPGSGGPRSQLEHQVRASGSLQRRDTNGSGSSRTEVVSSCLVCGAACLASGQGGEPTPGEYAPSVHVRRGVVLTNNHDTEHRQLKMTRREPCKKRPDLPVVSMGRRNTSLIRGGWDGAWLSEVVSRG